MSEGFSAVWLRLREPYDARARDPHLLADLAKWRAGRGHLRVVDLGSGTGANLRRTAPNLGGEQSWTLVDRDPHLISSGERQLVGATVAWHYRRLDLAAELERLGDRPYDLITASALLDLVSVDWLDRLLLLAGRSGAALYFALSYDGRIAWKPTDELDGMVTDLVNAHQRTDKGLGCALGPDAAQTLALRLAGSAGNTRLGVSDWVLGPSDMPLQLAMATGFAEAAVAMSPEAEADLHAWAERRRGLIERGCSWLQIGHIDVLRLPFSPPAPGA